MSLLGVGITYQTLACKHHDTRSNDLVENSLRDRQTDREKLALLRLNLTEQIWRDCKLLSVYLQMAFLFDAALGSSSFESFLGFLRLFLGHCLLHLLGKRLNQILGLLQPQASE